MPPVVPRRWRFSSCSGLSSSSTSLPARSVTWRPNSASGTATTRARSGVGFRELVRVFLGGLALLHGLGQCLLDHVARCLRDVADPETDEHVLLVGALKPVVPGPHHVDAVVLDLLDALPIAQEPLDELSGDDLLFLGVGLVHRGHVPDKGHHLKLTDDWLHFNEQNSGLYFIGIFERAISKLFLPSILRATKGVRQTICEPFY